MPFTNNSDVLALLIILSWGLLAVAVQFLVVWATPPSFSRTINRDLYYAFILIGLAICLQAYVIVDFDQVGFHVDASVPIVMTVIDVVIDMFVVAAFVRDGDLASIKRALGNKIKYTH